jgi:signal transduction histidine kinase
VIAGCTPAWNPRSHPATRSCWSVLVANLVDNAVRYNVPGGDIWIGTGTEHGQARLDVANTGPVVDPSNVERLFQPFQRLADRTTGEGFGLGPAIVASIGTVHGGTVSGRPRNGGGLEVTVILPGVADHEELPRSVPHGESSGASFDWARL